MKQSLNLTYRQLLALYTVSERVFRWKQMLLFRGGLPGSRRVAHLVGMESDHG